MKSLILIILMSSYVYGELPFLKSSKSPYPKWMDIDPNTENKLDYFPLPTNRPYEIYIGYKGRTIGYFDVMEKYKPLQRFVIKNESPTFSLKRYGFENIDFLTEKQRIDLLTCYILDRGWRKKTDIK